ncbi:DNA-packaging protein [Asticcacaulis endophyticus]|uniref:DNA-packaging protein n=1 Tax=Asticcacaulis endophyticus TaxID=1395890 RepID=UPI001E54066A|nr:terminase family protein [Asticcacaulis endophyticus]
MNANSIALLTPQARQAWLDSLTIEQFKHLHKTWAFWARPVQLAPEGDWKTWLFLGGRGAGKTRAGAEWLSACASRRARLALIGPTLHDVREVMIEGPSGLMAIAADDMRPVFEPSRRRVKWPNGAIAYTFSAEEPERLRGPQFHHAWADEFCAWRQPAETLAMLRMGLRLGDAPRLCVTTTPKPIRALKTLMAEVGVEVARSATAENKAGLSEDFLSGLLAIYGGTRLAAQELEGAIVDSDDHALWRAEDIARCYGAQPPQFDSVVVAVDPPVSDHGDACGIVVAGRRDGRGYVLQDATVEKPSPLGWANQVVEMVAKHGADRVVAEGNQGGEMVRSILATAGCDVAIEIVHARVGKRARAEPVAALYEQGRVTHCGAGRFLKLEEEMMALGRGEGGSARSPDRADALVWALTALLITGRAEPRLSRL